MANERVLDVRKSAYLSEESITNDIVIVVNSSSNSITSTNESVVVVNCPIIIITIV